jgi:hypothetical protein
MYGEIPLSIQEYLPWQVCLVDLFGPWTFKDKDGNEHKLQALSIINIATRWPKIVPYSSKCSEDISLLFDQVWLCRYPHPETVIFDNVKEFSSKFVELLSSCGIKPKPTTVKKASSKCFH